MARKSIKKRQFLTFYLVLVVMGTSIIAIGTQLLFPPPTLEPLAYLPVPAPDNVYLPGPWESSHKATSVLGAETINPRDIITYVNEERMNRDAPPLLVNQTLMKAAQMRADVILKHQNFSHQDPFEGIQLDTVLPKLNYPFAYASENIGMGEFTGRGFVTGFMNSPSHRDNLLNPTLVETGVAIGTGPYKQYYVNIAVQLFAIPPSGTNKYAFSKDHLEDYESLLADIEKQIALSKDLWERRVEDAQYYEGWHRVLVRQKEIVLTLYHALNQEQPVTKQVIGLFEEFNKNWGLAPKKT